MKNFDRIIAILEAFADDEAVAKAIAIVKACEATRSSGPARNIAPVGTHAELLRSVRGYFTQGIHISDVEFEAIRNAS